MRTSGQTVKVNFRFTEGLRNRLDSLSLRMDVPITDVVRKAVESYEPDAIQVRPTPEDRKRIDDFCAALGCSPNFLLRCALVEYLDKIDQHGFRTSILIPPGPAKEFIYPPKAPALADDKKEYKMTAEERRAYEDYLATRGPIGVIAAGTPSVLHGAAETEHSPPTPAPKPVSYGPKKTLKPKKQ